MNTHADDSPPSRAILWSLAAIIAVGAVLRIYFVDSALWYDEMVTMMESVRAPFAELVTKFPSNNSHVFYSLLARSSVLLLGEHPWSLRLPAVLFGIASLPLLYVVGAYVSSRFEALAATALLAISYHHIWFSQNARGYTILLFGTLLTTYLLLLGMREKRRWPFVAFAAIAAISAYTHLTMVLAVVGQAVVVVWDRVAQRRGTFDWRSLAVPVVGFVLAGVLTVLLYAPMLLDVRSFFGSESKGAVVATPGWAILETVRGLRLGYSAAGAIACGALVFAAGCWSYWRQNPTVLALFLVPGAVLFTVAALLQRPTFPRFFFFLIGFALLIVVRGTTVTAAWLARRLSLHPSWDPRQRLLPCLFLMGIAVVSLLALPAAYRYPKQDYEEAMRFVEARTGPGDLVVLAGGGTAVPYRDYFHKPWERLATADNLGATLQQHDTVWLLYTFGRYIETLEPDLMRAIRARCTIVKAFPGTVADGAIVVSKCGSA